MLPLILLAACTKGGSSDSDSAATCESVDIQGTAPEDLSVAEAPAGDLDCVSDWLEACPVTTTSTPTDIRVLDWREGWETGETLTIEGSSVALQDGSASATLPACTATSVQVSVGEWVNAWPKAVPELGELDLEYVSESANSVAYGAVGKPIRDGGAHVYGSVVDCIGMGVGNAEIVLIEGGSTYYPNSDGLPSSATSATDRSGEFFVLDARAGSNTLEAWVSDGAGGHTLIARSRFNAQPNQVEHIQLQAGGGSGYGLPESCLQ